MTTQKYSLKQVRKLFGMTRQELSGASGISVASIFSIENGSCYKTNQSVALALAEALGLEVQEIVWPRGLSHMGRPAKTGKPIQANIKTVIPICPVHNLVLPVTGICDNCS